MQQQQQQRQINNKNDEEEWKNEAKIAASQSQEKTREMKTHSTLVSHIQKEDQTNWREKKNYNIIKRIIDLILFSVCWFVMLMCTSELRRECGFVFCT